MRARALIVAGLFVNAILACSSDPPAPDASVSCPNDLPSACPAPPPSFANEIEPIFAQRCWGCHADGGVAVGIRDLSTYDGIASHQTTVLSQFYSCKMPPSDAGQPTAAERQKMLAWLVCKAPNN
jgi:uncharacterized membrane protein